MIGITRAKAASLHCPEAIRRSFSTTNAVEAVNGQLEIMRRNNGGYFHSQEILKLKLSLAISSLETGSWKSPARSISAVLSQLDIMFQSRFETAADPVLVHWLAHLLHASFRPDLAVGALALRYHFTSIRL